MLSSWHLAALAFILLAPLGCTKTEVVYVTPSPNSGISSDEPSLSSQAAVGLVARQCGDAQIGAIIRSSATAEYDGDGRWTVSYFDDTWEVYEQTGVAVAVGQNTTDVICSRRAAD